MVGEGQHSHHLLGYMMILQLTARLLLVLSSSATKLNFFETDSLVGAKDPDSTTELHQKTKALASGSSKCPLCLEVRNVSTLTPCGHLYCWSCICEVSFH